ncbi:MAG: hypothetical protein MHPSP_001570, partial [Paramarteilia canceri]
RQSVLHIAAGNNNIAVFDKFVASGPLLNERNIMLDQIDNFGYTPRDYLPPDHDMNWLKLRKSSSNSMIASQNERKKSFFFGKYVNKLIK